MKNHVKKALAGLLSVVMAFGIVSPAFAAYEEKGSIESHVRSNEGAVPPDVFQVELPTRRNGMFDFIIDPNAIIAQSNAVTYRREHGNDITFDDGKLFFQNVTKDSDGYEHVSFSKRSDSLIVTNRSSVPVDVVMNVEISKQGYDFEFAKTEDFKDASGNAITGPSMYFAMVNAKRHEPVQPVTVETDGVSTTKYAAQITAWIPAPDDAYEIAWKDGAYLKQIKAGTEESAFHSSSFHLTGALGDGAWPESMGDIRMNVNWDIIPPTSASQYTEAPFTVPDTRPEMRVREGAALIGDVAKLIVDFGSGTTLMPNLDGIVYVNEDESTGLFTPEDGITMEPLDEFEYLVSVTANEALLSAVNWFVKVSNAAGDTVSMPFDFIKPDDNSTEPTAEVTEKVTKSGTWGKITVDWGTGRYEMTGVKCVNYVRDTGEEGSISGSNVTVEDNVVSVKLASTPFKGHDFVLVLENNYGRTYEIPVDLTGTAAPVEEGTDPTATVTTKATAVGESAVLNVNWGTGAKAATGISKVTYTKSDGTAGSITSSNITTNGNTVSIKIGTTPFAGSDFVLVFSGGSALKLPVDLVGTGNEPEPEPGESADPTATVTTKATAAGESAVLNVNWGTGAKAMTTVTKVSYTKATGSAGSITGTNITTSGNTVTVKIGSTPFAGKDFVLVFANDSGATFELPVDLLEISEAPTPSGEDRDPSATVTQKVSASGESAVLTVGWGSGSKAMTRISKVSYTKAAGGAGSITGTNITTSGNTVTVKVGATPFAGKDFVLVFANDSGATFELPVELVEISEAPTPSGEDRDPSVTVTQKVSASGQSAVLTVDWGSGSKAMTKISKVSYTKVAGGKSSISGTNITTSGNTVTVKVGSTPFAGRDFILVFANDSGATFEAPIELIG